MGHTPFHLQVTEWDCVPTTFINALSLLFEREQIPPDVIQRVWLYGLDYIGPKQQQGRGTSGAAIALLCEWLYYKTGGHFSVEVERLEGPNVTPSKEGDLLDHLHDGAPALLSVVTKEKKRHYVLALAEVDGWVYGFDPYPRPKSSEVGAVEWNLAESAYSNLPYRPKNGQHPNIRIHTDRLAQESGTYCLGTPAEREVVLMYNRHDYS